MYNQLPSFKICAMVLINTVDKDYKISINEIEEDRQIPELIDFLSSKIVLKTKEYK